MTQILCALLFLSGMASLIFETLWFRQASLAFGSSFWASSIVLASFMTGLGLGNGLVSRYGSLILRPLRAYAIIEIVIGISGATLVFTLPHSTVWVTPLLQPFFDQPWILNPVRLLVGFFLLVIPAIAMGATLPVLVKAMMAKDPNFGSVLGRLYGWNTLGAVLGALAGEVALIEWLGLRGSGLAAAATNGVAASVAFVLDLRTKPRTLAAPRQTQTPPPLTARARRALFAASISGAALLALEVVWFRFLHLFSHSGGLGFSIMLAVVLAAIALGGLAAGMWLRRDPEADRHAMPLALLTGALLIFTYASFQLALSSAGNRYIRDAMGLFWLASALMFPVSLMSGILFTFIGSTINREHASETRSTGLLTLANTIGSALGSLLAGFLLLPWLGIERTFFLLATLYGGVALLLAGKEARVLRFASVALFLASLLFFPFGLMRDHYLMLTTANQWKDYQVVEVREGRTETAIYLRRDFMGKPLNYKLMTDGFGMSGSKITGRRYMKLYVYWPVALKPNLKQALLISYGVGSTAKALTDTRSLEEIHVVDLSREILEMSDLVFPDPNQHPLRDPRVKVFIEDGRYFLQTTETRYDLITAEPPPPKNAGIVNLYTREYFRLVYDRLNEGGICTYWLPMLNLLEPDAKAITRGFCEVFEDCSLWAGANLDFMLVGSRNAKWERSETAFVRQWQDPVVGPELRALGFEFPAQLGALFIADAPALQRLTRDTLPLVDDFPKRISNELISEIPAPALVFGLGMGTNAAMARFNKSTFIRKSWPEEIRKRALPFFHVQQLVNRTDAPPIDNMLYHMTELHDFITNTPYRTLLLWHLRTSDDEIRIAEALAAEGKATVETHHYVGMRELADRNFEAAARHFERAQGSYPEDPYSLYYWLYSLCMAERCDAAAEIARSLDPGPSQNPPHPGYWRWMAQTFDLIHLPPL